MKKRRETPPKLPGYTHEIEQAKIDGVQLSTLQKWRSQGRGQAYIKHFRQIYYIDADRPRYLASLKVDPSVHALTPENYGRLSSKEAPVRFSHPARDGGTKCSRLIASRKKIAKRSAAPTPR